eukprot:s1575_g2.t1
MAGLADGPRSREDEGAALRRAFLETAENAPGTEDLPVPRFGREPRRLPAEPHRDRSRTTHGGQATQLGGSGIGTLQREVVEQQLGEVMSEGERSGMSPMDGRSGRGEDPWLHHDPWQVQANENWSSQSSVASQSGSDYSHSWHYGRWQNWDSGSDGASFNRSQREMTDYDADNWSNRSWRSANGWHENWSSRPARSDAWGDYAWDEWYVPQHAAEEPRFPVSQRDVPGVYQGDQHEAPDGPLSPQAPAARDGDNRPSGTIPSGQPSIAGNGSSQGGGTTASSTMKPSSSYPPIFNARPGESWEQYWRSVTFWIASEGKSLPIEMRGPRVMQQLRERAAKIVQHLLVEDVAKEDGLQLIKKTMEKSPIIKLLDQKKVDQRRQKFMRLSRLPSESIESFLNRAEIYRKENETSPAYKVGSKFYVGHLLDAAKLTKRDLALVKAASGGTLDDEDLVIASLMDLAEQLEGMSGCPIGRGEPTLDQEDKYLVQKAGAGATGLFGNPSGQGQEHRAGGAGRRSGGRRRFYPRRKFRDALMAILEDDDQEEELWDEDEPLDGMGEDSMDEDDADPTAFPAPINPVLETSATTSTTTSTASSSAGSDSPLAEIYAQEYKARNRDREHVKRWVQEQQKTEPCFICRQLGHWSQECPYRKKAPIHATNVTFKTAAEPNWDILAECVQSDAQYKVREPPGEFLPRPYEQFAVDTFQQVSKYDVCWSMQELGNKMILDLGCMKTVAGTTWINPLVLRWKQLGRYVKVVPEEESFRFGDGHINKSRFAVILVVIIANIPCALRISVVGGDCPPLLSKPVCSALALTVDTANHVVSSKRYGVKAYGLKQSHGGHYLLPIDQFPSDLQVPADLYMPDHLEVMPLISSGSDKFATSQPTLHSDRAPLSHVETNDSACRSASSGELMGERGDESWRRVRGGRGAADGDWGPVAEVQGEVHVTEEGFEGRGRVRFDAGHAESDGADADDVPADARNDEYATAGRRSGSLQSGRAGRDGEDQEAGQAQQTCGLDRDGGSISVAVSRVLHGHHIQRGQEHLRAEHDVQVEDATIDDAHEGRGGEGFDQTLEAELAVDPTHGRAALGSSVGTSGGGTTALLQSSSLSSRRRGGGIQRPQSAGQVNAELTDPNAPTTREQLRREGERIDLVSGPLHDPVSHGDAVCGDGLSAEVCGADQEPACDAFLGGPECPGEPAPARKKITLNRRQTRSIRQGVEKALRTHKKLLEVSQMKGKTLSLMEIFAGRANLSETAKQSGKWHVLPPQDKIYGLDILNPEHVEILKDVIRTQEPDVITLSPPCGPWSSWQRMRKRKDILQALRREHLPFWEFVLWVWSFQSARGALAVLEQPKQSEALHTRPMQAREEVYEKVVDLCRLGLMDRITMYPHKKPTAIQMNHPVIQTPAFPDRRCECQPGDHQPIEGSVRIRDELTGRLKTVRRSTLAAEWTPEFCQWLLCGLESALTETSLSEMDHPSMLQLHRRTPANRFYETVPVEVEQTPEGQLRQHMQLNEYGTRYDYIHFDSDAAMLTKTLRSTMAHLHVALGHISNDKLKRMLSLNGAKEEILRAVDHLQCQICNQVKSPMATPKAAFARPMSFNERIVMDTFYVWDAQQVKFAVTHILDTFSLYQVAVAVDDPSSQATMELLRDRWIGVFGPPSVLMTDQGSEFRGHLEALLRTFAIFHEIVPPTAHWRMSLAERHGAVLKVMLMKVIKELTVIGLEEVQTAVVSVTAARNRQARVAGFSPVQLVFGKDTSIPSNLMDAMAGQFHFQLARPDSTDESFQRAAQMRKAANDAFQWMEATDALKRAAGSRARLPKLELLSEGAQVMFWEPPAHRRGLSRRLQDDIAWIGPAVVAALERKDGAIKRVWVRYQNKLKGMPLEFVRMTVPEEMEATKITKEALDELAKQLQDGRVNADQLESSSSSSSSTSSEGPPDSKKAQPATEPGKQETQERATGSSSSKPNRQDAKQGKSRVTKEKDTKQGKSRVTKEKDTQKKSEKEQEMDPYDGFWQLSDEEMDAPNPISEETVKKASSALDDVPISLHRKNLPVGPAVGRPQKKAKTADGGPRGDPALRPFIEKRAVYDSAMKKTEDHFKAMKHRLEPKSVQVVMPSQMGSANPELITIPVKNAGPPYFKVDRFKIPETTDSDQELMNALAFEQDFDVHNNLGVRCPEDLRRYTFYEEEVEDPRSVTRDMPTLVRMDDPNVASSHAMPPTPTTRARLPLPLSTMHQEVPQHLRRPLTKEQQRIILRRQYSTPAPAVDYWVVTEEEMELCRVHVVPRLHLFDPPDGMVFPEGIDREWITGVRATQVYYLNNPLSRDQQRSLGADAMVATYPGDPRPRLKEFILDNINWLHWNTQMNLLGLWQGITRFQIRPPGETDQSPTLVTWLEGRHFAEEMWRRGDEVARAYSAMSRHSGWPNATLMTSRLGPMELEEVQEVVQFLENAQTKVFRNQLDILDTFFTFVHYNDIKQVTPASQYRGITELTHLPEEPIDVTKPETGKVRLELKWNDLTPKWQLAFQEPIIEALRIYFQHDALAPVMPDEIVDDTEVLPSRFVLVNKSDPRNPHPSDEQLDGAKLKARLVIAGHKDQKAGEYETEAPTASLLAHNCLCFLAAQWNYDMYFADISAAFLQGDYLPQDRRVFLQTPKNYPQFVREFLLQQLPPGARTDLFRMLKGGFGLAESPRLWYKRFKRGAESIGGKEMTLCPGVFGFFLDARDRPQALLAVHVDDVRLIVDPLAADEMRAKLDSLFNFGDWVQPREWTKFCGRYEKQLEDGTVLFQMDEYADRLLDPPQRPQGQHFRLQPNEKKWIGTICGQLNWMARQCRADLSFGVSRVQQLAGVDDRAALVELQVLVERARQRMTIKYEKLDCDLNAMVMVCTSDASFAGMPRGRSQGGCVVAMAHPKILDGQAQIAILMWHSGLLKRVVRSSLAAEISQAATAMEEGDFCRALLAEMSQKSFSLSGWLPAVSIWQLILVLDLRTGYDLLNGTALGEDKRLAIDIASMRQALHEDGASRLVRWVPGEELISDDLTKLNGNGKLMQVLSTARWALRDTEVARKLRQDAAARKKVYRQRISADRQMAETRLVLRGKKCVLARDADKNLRIPLEEAALKETAQQAAVRALAEACDIYPEEFFMLQDVAPAVYYEGSTVVSIFAALATNPPPPGASEDEDLLDEDDVYDWFRYDSAVARLPLQQRRSVERLSGDVRAALVAQVVTSDYPCDFGSDVVEAPPEAGASDFPRGNGYRANFGDEFNWRRAKTLGSLFLTPVGSSLGLAVVIHNLRDLKAHQDEAVMLRSAKVTQRPKFNHWVSEPGESDEPGRRFTARSREQAQRSALLSLLQVPGGDIETQLALQEFQQLELSWGQDYGEAREAGSQGSEDYSEDLVPVLRALAAKDLWQNALDIFFEDPWSKHSADVEMVRDLRFPPWDTICALNATLNACQRAGRWEACFALLQHSLHTRRSSLDVISFNSAINACQEGAAWLEALQLLQMMEREGILANDITCSSCISVCGAAAQWQRSLSLLHRTKHPKHGSVVSLGAALNACAKGEAWEQALCLYQLMQRGDTKPNVICGNAVLNAFSKALQWRQAMAWLQEMPKTTVISFNSVLSALRHSWTQSLALLLQMRDMSIVNAASYNTCIASMGTALQWPRALLLFEGRVGEAFMDNGLASLLLCLSTHVIRSLIDWSGKDQLEKEVTQLRVEVHRTKELVASFNSVLETCERMDRSLNIAEPQVLLHYPNDGGGFYHHHRVLLHKIGNGQWVVLTPDLDLEVVNLANHRHRVWGRHAPLPDDIADESYIFDELSRAELERQKRLAKTMGAILDDSEIVNVESIGWYGADPSSKKFGVPLPVELVGDIAAVGQHGVVTWEDSVEFVRELSSSELEKFKEERKDSLRDARLLGDHRDPQGKRHMTLQEALSLMSEEKFDDWAFTGPRATKEYLTSVRDGPGDLITYHAGWVRASGIAQNSAIAHEHRTLVETLRLGLSRDQLDLSNLCSFENICRRLMVLEIAASRNPSAPDFTGLDVVTEAPIAQHGQAQVSSMTSWVTERLKERAQIQKQARLFKEEFNKGAKKTGGGEEEDQPGGKNKWRRKKKNDKADAGGAPGPAGGN